jgi:hypothetical protein
MISGILYLAVAGSSVTLHTDLREACAEKRVIYELSNMGSLSGLTFCSGTCPGPTLKRGKCEEETIPGSVVCEGDTRFPKNCQVSTPERKNLKFVEDK